MAHSIYIKREKCAKQDLLLRVLLCWGFESFGGSNWWALKVSPLNMSQQIWNNLVFKSILIKINKIEEKVSRYSGFKACLVMEQPDRLSVYEKMVYGALIDLEKSYTLVCWEVENSYFLPHIFFLMLDHIIYIMFCFHQTSFLEKHGAFYIVSDWYILRNLGSQDIVRGLIPLWVPIQAYWGCSSTFIANVGSSSQ